MIILLSLGVMMSGCGTPTPIVQLAPTDLPATPTTMPPTATALPPTVTATPTATSTPTQKPTATLTQTPTPAPTKPVAPPAAVTATARPTAASTTAANPVPVSAIPADAPLNAAVQRSFQTAQGILGEINNIVAGRSSRCDSLMAMYDLFATAPVYDVSRQSPEIQSAYALYREGVDLINATASKVRRICVGQGGGNIDKLELSLVQKSASKAIPLFGRASDLLPSVVATVPAPVAAATAKPVVSSITLSDLLLQTMERLHTIGGHLDGAQTDFNAGFCEQFKPLHQTVITIVGLNETGRDPTWIDSYGAYKVAVGYFQNKLYRAVEICAAGGSAIGKSEFGEMRRAVDVAAIAVARAYDQLRIKNLLGQ